MLLGVMEGVSSREAPSLDFLATFHRTTWSVAFLPHPLAPLNPCAHSIQELLGSCVSLALPFPNYLIEVIIEEPRDSDSNSSFSRPLSIGFWRGSSLLELLQLVG